MTDRAFLDDRAARYTHRRDYTQDDLDTAIRAATIEIGERLQSQVNEARLDVAAVDWTNPYPLPADCRGVRTIEYAGQGGPRSLSGVSREYMNRWSEQGGYPVFYTILAGNELHIRPYQAQDFTIYYWQEPAAITQALDSTNAVLQAYPQMYLYRVIAELAFLSQDVELANGYLSLFDNELGRVNISTKNANMGASPSMRGL